jgi:integrase
VAARVPLEHLERRGTGGWPAGGVGGGDGEPAAGRDQWLFAFRAMRDPSVPNPMPKGAAARRVAPEQRDGLLGHLARPQARSALRVREPRRLPRALDAGEASALLESLRSWRDRAIAGLMLFCGLRSAEVLALTVADVDIARGWARVAGRGGRERRVPVDAQVAGWVQTYLLAERPETTATALFVVAKGAYRGRPLTGRTAHDLPVSPGPGRGGGGASARAAALVRHRAGRGRG